MFATLEQGIGQRACVLRGPGIDHAEPGRDRGIANQRPELRPNHGFIAEQRDPRQTVPDGQQAAFDHARVFALGQHDMAARFGVSGAVTDGVERINHGHGGSGCVRMVLSWQGADRQC